MRRTKQRLLHFCWLSNFNLKINLPQSPDELPFSIRVLLESAVRNCDNFQVLEKDVKNILNWKDAKGISNDNDVEVSFKPARVILQGLYNMS